jgi:PAS domain S-box-containing protein
MALPFEYTAYIWLLLGSAVFLTAMGSYALRDLSVPGAVPFIILLAGIMLWVLANALGLASADDQTRIFWFKFRAAVLLPVISAELSFALEYAGLGNWLNRRTVLVLAFFPLVFLLLILTNDTHHLIWTQIRPEGYAHSEFGPAYWGAVFYAYLLSLLNVMVLIWLFARSPRHRWVAAGLIISLLITRGTYFLNIANWNPVAPLDPTVVAANFALLPYALAIFRLRMFDVVPVARHTVIEKMPDGMVVLDAENRIADVNETVLKLLGTTRSKVMGRKADEILQNYPELLRLVRDSDKIQCEALFGNTHDRWYQIFISPLIGRRGFHLGRTILFHDTTEQKRIQAELLDQQRTLAVLRERELLARELHDGIGQMLAAAHLQVTTAKELLTRGDTDSVGSCLSNLAETTQKAKESIREYLLGVKSRLSTGPGLLPALRQYINHYSHSYGIRIELIAPPELEGKRIGDSIEAQLQPIIQEALANVRRHSDSASARVIFSPGNSHIRVTVEDDGKGFDPDKIRQNPGFGLRSMRGRAEAAGASLEVISAPGKGTRVVILVPWRKEET